MLERKDAQKCTCYQSNLRRRSMVDFIAVLSAEDMWPQINRVRGRAVNWSPSGGELGQMVVEDLVNPKVC